MKTWLLAALAAGLALAPIASQATTTTKKHHASHMHRAVRAPGVVDPTGGNAAAGGNNANSMSGPNSAPENAEGRTGGSGGGMGR
jgi:hypothetical protein